MLFNDNSWRLEYEMPIKYLKECLPTKVIILDLGGTVGIYPFLLSKMRYEMYLVNLLEINLKPYYTPNIIVRNICKEIFYH